MITYIAGAACLAGTYLLGTKIGAVEAHKVILGEKFLSIAPKVAAKIYFPIPTIIHERLVEAIKANKAIMAIGGKYNVEGGNGNDLLWGPGNILGASEESERNNPNLIADALALSADIYCVGDNNQEAYYTRSYAESPEKGWIWLEDYNKYPYSYILPDEITKFLEQIKGLKYIDPKGTGLVSGVFFQLVNNRLRIAYVTKGTSLHKLSDWLHNLKQGWDGEDALYEASYNVAKEINAKIEKWINGIGHLYFFGHSLGGGMANYNAIKLKKPSVTFNAASVHPNTVAKLENLFNCKELVNNNSMIGLYTKREVLSLVASNIAGLPKNGNRYSITIAPMYLAKDNPIERHFLKPLCSQCKLKPMAWNNRGKTI